MSNAEANEWESKKLSTAIIKVSVVMPRAVPEHTSHHFISRFNRIAIIRARAPRLYTEDFSLLRLSDSAYSKTLTNFSKLYTPKLQPLSRALAQKQHDKNSVILDIRYIGN